MRRAIIKKRSLNRVFHLRVTNDYGIFIWTTDLIISHNQTGNIQSANMTIFALTCHLVHTKIIHLNGLHSVHTEQSNWQKLQITPFFLMHVILLT